MTIRHCLSAWILVPLLCACFATPSPASDVGAAETPADTVAPGELPLPDVPSTLTEPADRAEYIIAHFWDAMDFADTLRSHNRSFMEQNLVNYLSLFPHAPAGALPPNVYRLWQRASVDGGACALLAELAESYLTDADSPMRNEDHYILFLEQYLRLPGLSSTDRLRPSARLAMARRNRRGTIAADFAYTTREGHRSTLHATRAARLLLVFYDPACDHCTEVMRQLRANRTVNALIADGALAVLAVYTGGDRELWNKTKNDLPAEWRVAMDDDSIEERGQYDLAVMPVVYLLDGDKRVMLKNATVEEVEAASPQPLPKRKRSDMQK